ncbi:AbrB/MazE/SpoVT family DNA-binding domain-containing protein [Candidatus Dojkabacteria bacterium]|nr:AbrB/MazE/SpoVT family DNA-binding domain-containing protein [Candidatus Dojkabacteria bacterium]
MMKISKCNKLGQVVIPKELRKAQKITPETNLLIRNTDQGIVISPITDIILRSEMTRFPKVVLRKTRGKLKYRK